MGAAALWVCGEYLAARVSPWGDFKTPAEPREARRGPRPLSGTFRTRGLLAGAMLILSSNPVGFSKVLKGRVESEAREFGLTFGVKAAPPSAEEFL